MNLDRIPRVLRRIKAKIGRELANSAQRSRDTARPTYAVSLPPIAPLYSYFPALPLETLRPHAEWIAGLSAQYVAGRFDLLGSGWTEVRYGMECRGLEGHVYAPEPAPEIDAQGEWLAGQVPPNNLPESRRLWQLLDAAYVPIDWQRDFISGYRWNARIWYKDISYGKKNPGADVKVPWELARMQHLPTLAWAFGLAQAGEPGFAEPKTYFRAFRNQILDFIATNPPRFGVNWACTMDAAIRVSNWLVAYDLFKNYGAELDAEWDAVFRRSVWEHADFIAGNLEWSDTLRANHYLADIVGLLFCAAYLPRASETDTWLALSIQEFANEFASQLYGGVNFEGSTAYHRLAAEMVLYGLALFLALPAEKLAALQHYEQGAFTKSPELKPAPLPLAAIRKTNIEWPELSHYPPLYVMERIAAFAIDCTRPDGNIVQIGDNDSGRFLKLQPSVKKEHGVWRENDLDMRHLVATTDAFFDRQDFAEFADSEWFERDLIQAVIENKRLKSYGGSRFFDDAICYRNLDFDAKTAGQEWAAAAPENRKECVFEFPSEDLREGLRKTHHERFGLYLWRSPRLYLAVRCGPIGQNGNGGHSHNDQLSIELWVDGRPIVVDPGTFVYTPLPEQRNAYRSVRAHFAPYVEGKEPGDMTLGLFRLDSPGAIPLYVSPTAFVGRHSGYGSPVTRLIEIEANAIRVKDYAESLPLAEPQPDKLPYSDGYGKKKAI